jgi:hypothetical protein
MSAASKKFVTLMGTKLPITCESKTPSRRLTTLASNTYCGHVPTVLSSPAQTGDDGVGQGDSFRRLKFSWAWDTRRIWHPSRTVHQTAEAILSHPIVAYDNILHNIAENRDSTTFSHLARWNRLSTRNTLSSARLCMPEVHYQVIPVFKVPDVRKTGPDRHQGGKQQQAATIDA